MRQLRTLANVVGEVITPPAVSSFTNFAFDARRVELAPGVLTAVGAPTTITLNLWRITDGVITYAGKLDIPFASLGTATPMVFDFGYKLRCGVAVTVSFTGGTTPSVSGIVNIRPIPE